ncbi:Uncharacterised protein [Corynebacterium minutissimum]|uniref:Uncharacterized protein n=1 Tax=Corynebacterium minutissimum TaxID=38301 RepID=A0A376CTC3_9CORY|nr:Uncharacterised protein [Corynebacterium minutissimum]
MRPLTVVWSAGFAVSTFTSTSCGIAGVPANRGVVGGFQRCVVGAKLQLAPGGSGGWPVVCPVACSAASLLRASWYSGVAVIGAPQGGM